MLQPRRHTGGRHELESQTAGQIAEDAQAIVDDEYVLEATTSAPGELVDPGAHALVPILHPDLACLPD